MNVPAEYPLSFGRCRVLVTQEEFHQEAVEPILARYLVLDGDLRWLVVMSVRVGAQEVLPRGPEAGTSFAAHRDPIIFAAHAPATRVTLVLSNTGARPVILMPFVVCRLGRER